MLSCFFTYLRIFCWKLDVLNYIMYQLWKSDFYPSLGFLIAACSYGYLFTFLNSLKKKIYIFVLCDHWILYLDNFVVGWWWNRFPWKPGTNKSPCVCNRALCMSCLTPSTFGEGGCTVLPPPALPACAGPQSHGVACSPTHVLLPRWPEICWCFSKPLWVFHSPAFPVKFFG